MFLEQTKIRKYVYRMTPSGMLLAVLLVKQYHNVYSKEQLYMMKTHVKGDFFKNSWANTESLKIKPDI